MAQAPLIILALTGSSVGKSVFIECLQYAQLGEGPGVGEAKAPGAQRTELSRDPPFWIAHVHRVSACLLGPSPHHQPDPRSLHGTLQPLSYLYSVTILAGKCCLSEYTQVPWDSG